MDGKDEIGDALPGTAGMGLVTAERRRDPP